MTAAVTSIDLALVSLRSLQRLVGPYFSGAVPSDVVAMAPPASHGLAAASEDCAVLRGAIGCQVAVTQQTPVVALAVVLRVHSSVAVGLGTGHRHHLHDEDLARV